MVEDGDEWLVGAHVLHGFGQELWQHHVLDAIPHLGMALPLLRALGKRARLVHTGALTHRNVLAWIPPLAATRPARHLAPKMMLRRLNAGQLHPNFALAFTADARDADDAGPSDDRVPGLEWDRTVRGGFDHPSWAYWPFRLATHAAAATMPTPPLDKAPFVAYLARGSRSSLARRFEDESAIVRRLNETLRRLRLQLVPTTTAGELRGACGVIGLHGGALASIHTCAPGTRVIEILGKVQELGRAAYLHKMSKDPYWSYAGLSRGLGLEYFSYFPQKFPRNWASARDNMVTIDEGHLATFVAEVFGNAPRCVSVRSGGARGRGMGRAGSLREVHGGAEPEVLGPLGISRTSSAFDAVAHRLVA